MVYVAVSVFQTILRDFKKSLPSQADISTPQVIHFALVGVKNGNDSGNIPVICIERVKSKKRKIYLQEELQVIAAENPMTDQIKQILFHKSFPVDPRHNAKIYREKLSIWAKNRIL